ncbi:hypothetical protein HJC23_010861 [Cyclotella cryptica]|uniref:Uncharacterized protein n=1 Tax=Cyclotella cryptica TaxID=29204 RepID=A0ABD3QP08_9STRA
MLVGSKFRTVRSCTWAPTCGVTIPLPRRSLLVLGGNSGDIAKHCISACKGKRISITLRKQPPPDWKPDESELAGKKGTSAEQSKHRAVGEVACNEMGDRPKKKSLSGSAKRRKKMMKQRGLQSGDDGAASTDRFCTNMILGGEKRNISATNRIAEGTKTDSGDKKARRNVRQLVKRRNQTKYDTSAKNLTQY